MANGRVIFWGADEIRVALLDAQSASSDGQWVEVPEGFVFRSFDVTLPSGGLEEGASDATVEIMVSNAEDQPTNATDGRVTQTLNTTTEAASKTEAYRWVKAKKTAGTTPVATTVIMVAVKQFG